MALPLVAYVEEVNFERPVGIDGLTWPMTTFYYVRKGFRQRRPYDIDTSYTYDDMRHISGSYSDPRAWSWNLMNSGFETDAWNSARAKFTSELGEASSFGATLTAERKETWNSVVQIILRCAKAAKAITRLRFFEAAQLLGLPYNQRTKKKITYRTDTVSRKNGLGKRKIRTRIVTNEVVFSYGTRREYTKTLANGWLMYSYGVKPLLSDIYNGMDVLQRPFPSTRVKGFGRAEMKQTQYPISGLPSFLFSGSVKATVAAYVRVDNPNLWLLNKMGLINPIQWINEGIPFSFVADWFSNLSAVISQMTDFVGLELDRPCTCTKYTMRESKVDDYKWGGTKEWVHFSRSLSIPAVKLVFKYERFEWQRGLNAISLLVGFLPRK